MFASGRTELKLQYITLDNKLVPVGEYKDSESESRPEGVINQIAWSYDNNYIALLHQNGRLKILNAKDRNNPKLVHAVSTAENIISVAFKRRTKRVMALGTVTGKVIFYDTKNRKILSDLEGFDSPVRVLEFNSSDDQIIVGCKNFLHLLKDSNGKNDFERDLTIPYSSKAKFHPSLPHVLGYGDIEGCLTLLDTKNNEIMTRNHKDLIHLKDLAFTNEPKLVVTLDSSNKISVFEYPSLFYMFGTTVDREVNTIGVSPDDLFIAAGLADGSLCVYQIWNPAEAVLCTKIHDGSISKIAFVHTPRMNPSPNLFENQSKTSLNVSECSQSMGESVHSVGMDETKMKKMITRCINAHVSRMEEKLSEQSSKFQMYLFRELDILHNSLARWDVFNTCDSVSDFLASHSNVHK